ncbi:prolyl 4-hydroxylase subunit alpha-2 [Anastrepha ludens]|uniref:prolyl 4-hydroxylase subunit alpha-2 n=1 Tax=Anastrepha ludens TaxID=28586 RepID=UPI0023AF61C2|nr:prolyl 4-hydroxylase subunit alpha-2 [Anastrepha ludens]
MKSIHLIILGLLALLSHNSKGDYYTSIASLFDLLDVETRAIAYVEKYMEEMEEISRQVNNTLQQLERVAKEADSDPEDYYENPLNAYKIISRFAIDWRNLHKTLFDEKPTQNNLPNTANVEEADVPEPTHDDLVGASKGLARLQNTYRLETIDVAEGYLMDWNYSQDFTASECYWLGRSLYAAGEYKYAAEWLMQAHLRLVEELKAPDETWQLERITDVQVLEFLAPSMHHLGKSKLAILLNDKLLEQDPTNVQGLQSKALYSEKALEERHAKSLDNLSHIMPQRSEIEKLFDSVCNGDVHQTPREQRNLRCRYVHNNVPFCFIAPFKKEELNHDPAVAYYHEAIYDSEIQRILDQAVDKVERSMVGSEENHNTSDVRTSQNTWLDFEEHSFLNNMAQRLRDITGLVLETGEQLQVANYGIGGHYGAHYDFTEDEQDTFDGQGNRLLTALFYINDVELGGATAFPYLRLAVPPIRRSMVVWYNMHKSLEVDYRTKHGGCPVLMGSKWICNEWFHEAEQEFKRPCGLESDGHKSLKFKNLHLSGQ